MHVLRTVSFSMAIAFALAPAAPAQTCGGTTTFWQRDTLPADPTSIPTGVSVIQGINEGESAGVVFELPAGMPPQVLTRVVAPWGAAFGASGFQALLDVEVYDGVSFSGATVNMGQRVFQLSTTAAQNLSAQSHGLNTLDVTPYGIVVGGQPPVNGVRRFAVCFRVDVNLHPTGSNQTGWPASFFTDNASLQFTCNPSVTPTGTSILEIAGQGWRDAALATVQGVPLCPLFFSGVFAIRACTEDAFPATYTITQPGCPNSIGTSTLLAAQSPRLGQTLLVNITDLPIGLGLMVTGTSDQVSTFGPLPFDLSALGMTGCTLYTSADATDGLITFGTTASWSLAIPNQTPLLGLQFYQQAFAFDPGLNPFGGAMSDAATFVIGS